MAISGRGFPLLCVQIVQKFALVRFFIITGHVRARLADTVSLCTHPRYQTELLGHPISNAIFFNTLSVFAELVNAFQATMDRQFNLWDSCLIFVVGFCSTN